MPDDVDRIDALQELIKATIEALGEEKAKPFVLEANFECVNMEDDASYNELCPKIRLEKK